MPSPALGDVNRRRSARLMPPFKGSKHDQNSGVVDKKSGERSKMPPRMLLSLCGVPHELDLEKFHPPDFFDHLKDCATLAIQDHCIINFEDWRDLRVVKIHKALKIRVSGFVYRLTFQAQSGSGGRLHTFEAHVWETTCFRRVNRVRTISPITTQWRPGNLWIPLIHNPTIDKKSRKGSRISGGYNCLQSDSVICKNQPRRSSRLDESNKPFLLPLDTMRCDTRLANGYERPEIIAQGKGPVYLKREKLSDSDLDILDDCATLATQDHFIRHMYIFWRDWHLAKVNKALREKATCLRFHGYKYYLTFQAQNGDCIHTFEAEVFDSSAQRLVSRVRMINPCTTEWYPGDLWIPL